MGHIFEALFPGEEQILPAQRITDWYSTALFFGLPLVMWNGFFAVTEAKAAFFALITAIYFAVLAVIRLRFGRGCFPPRGRLNGAELAMVGFVLLSCLSALLSGDVAEAFVGGANRYQGIVSLLCYLGIYHLFGRTARLSKRAFAALTAAFIISAVLGVLNHFGADPLGTVAPLSSFDRGRYLSTFGNINFFGSYICLFLPAFLYLACACKERTARIWMALCYAIGLAAAMTARSESTVLGLGAAILLLPLCLSGEPEAFRRIPLVLLIGLTAMALMHAFNNLFGGARFSILTQVLLRPGVMLSFTVACCLAYFLLRRTGEGTIKRLRRGLIVMYIGLIVLMIAALVLINTAFSNVPATGALRYLRFDGSWGTDRGAIWEFCLKTYREFPFWQKLIGGGPACVLRADMVSPLFPDALLDTAHNEYLQYLLTGGALGLLCYLAMLIFTVRASLKKQCGIFPQALLMGVFAYALQAVVNIAQPASTPLFFAVLAVLNGYIKAPPPSGDMDG